MEKETSHLNGNLNLAKKRLNIQNKILQKAKEGLKLGKVSKTEFRKMQRNITYNEADLKGLTINLIKLQNLKIH
ncbi:Hypothetical protein BN85411250 [Alteracholeplasma palmae J233]|uniref:Uncharacterized protein n=1 Tax=Alteracholeplasma palmae (strain ATCC 49389 / J233) TaxID=1318466 RepID=U4KLH8_ALTPJ|nr:hypothetical protein [Alteracholeplasma palmae]CCV64702.1 Hypothetical protein BN85411250 [Alteracholeplasma palmae J233]